MAYEYRIRLQLSKPGNDKPPLSDFDEEIRLAQRQFNGASRFAKNPKRIVDFCYEDDGRTLVVHLRSNNVLKYPAKGLRLFSNLLLKGTLQDYIDEAKRQLFTAKADLMGEATHSDSHRTTTSGDDADREEKQAPEKSLDAAKVNLVKLIVDCDDLDKIEAATALLQSARQHAERE